MHERFSAALNALKRTDLMSLGKACGVVGGTTKATRADHIIAALERSSELYRRPFRLISIDPGLKNLALAELEVSDLMDRPLVKRWSLHSLMLSKTPTSLEISDKVVKFVDELRAETLDLGAVVIEKQSSAKRASSSWYLLRVFAHLNLVEGILFAVLRSQQRTTVLESLYPKSVASFWDTQLIPLEHAHTSSDTDEWSLERRRYLIAKGKRRVVVKKWLSDLRESPVTFHTVQDIQGKRDDLDDVLVQGYTYILWLRNRFRLFESLESGRDPLEGIQF